MQHADGNRPSGGGPPPTPAPGRRDRMNAVGVSGLMAFVDLCSDCTVLYDLRAAGWHDGDAVCSVHLMALVRAIGACSLDDAHALAGWYHHRMQREAESPDAERPDSELAGMWQASDLSGGFSDGVE